MSKKKRKQVNYRKLIIKLFSVFCAIIVGIGAFLISKGTSPNEDAQLPSENPQACYGDLRVYAIDVGQGDSFLLISPMGRTMLIDSGESNQDEVVISFLRDRGVEKVDIVVASHPHTDHIGSMASILDEFETDRILLPEVDYPTNTYTNLLETIDDKKIERVYAWSGDIIEWDSLCKVTVLSPVAGGEYSNADMNEWSIMLRVEYGDTSMLFTGDAETHSEQLAMFSNSAYLFDADVLKVGHHGSDTSSSSAFLEAVSPEYAIISVGEENTYGHPRAEVLEKLQIIGAEVYRTDILGSIEIILDGKEITIQPCTYS